MNYSFPIGTRQCCENKILVEVKYTIKARQINLSTFIYAVGVTLVDGNTIKDQWVLRFLALCNHHLKLSFYSFLERLISTIIIIDSVLYSIGAVELMKLQENAELKNLRKSMLSMGVTMLEHDDIYHYSNSRSRART